MRYVEKSKKNLKRSYEMFYDLVYSDTVVSERFPTEWEFDVISHLKDQEQEKDFKKLEFVFEDYTRESVIPLQHLFVWYSTIYWNLRWYDRGIYKVCYDGITRNDESEITRIGEKVDFSWRNLIDLSEYDKKTELGTAFLFNDTKVDSSDYGLVFRCTYNRSKPKEYVSKKRKGDVEVHRYRFR